MIRYFCNVCGIDITSIKRIVVAYKENDTQLNYHYCEECGSAIKRALDGGNEKHNDKKDKTEIQIKESDDPFLGKGDPEVPRNHTNLELYRHILISYYMGDAIKTVMDKTGLTYNKVYYALSRYGSVKQKQLFDDLDVVCEGVSVRSVLNLFREGFGTEYIATDEIGCPKSVVDKIIQHYAGF